VRSRVAGDERVHPSLACQPEEVGIIGIAALDLAEVSRVGFDSGDRVNCLDVGLDLVELDIAAKAGSGQHSFDFIEKLWAYHGSQLPVAHKVDHFGGRPLGDETRNEDVWVDNESDHRSGLLRCVLSLLTKRFELRARQLGDLVRVDIPIAFPDRVDHIGAEVGADRFLHHGRG
jgi:hypothetical protein